MSIETLPALRLVRPPWNKGRTVGQMRPLLPKHVWSIRVRLEMADNERDLALFNMAIDCKLRGCDLVCLKVNNVYAAGRVKKRALATQSKTRKPVRFEITENTRLSLDRWINDPEMIGPEQKFGLDSMLQRGFARPVIRTFRSRIQPPGFGLLQLFLAPNELHPAAFLIARCAAEAKGKTMIR